MIASDAYSYKIMTIKGSFDCIFLDLLVAVVEANFCFPGIVTVLQTSIFWYS